MGELWEVGKELGLARAVGEETEDFTDRDACPADAGLAEADGRVNRDAAQVFHA